jgi:amidophosphoribosyltransferase
MMPLMVEAFGEKCAVVGVEGQEAAKLVMDGLIALQNRGSASSGTAVMNELGNTRIFRASGSASHVYRSEEAAVINGWDEQYAVGHDLYSTTGPRKVPNQPFGTERVVISHNGNCSVLSKLEEPLAEIGIRHPDSNDSVLAGLHINASLERGATITEAISRLMNDFEGSLSCTALIKDSDSNPVLAAFRDRHGIRPLAVGRTKNGGYAFASETHGLDAMGATYLREVNPGEIILVQNGELKSYQVAESDPKFDIFEIIYFSNPNSLFRGVRIGDIRAGLGRQMAAEYSERQSVDPHSLVIGIPQSGYLYAESFAEELNLEYQPAITKDLSIGRSFMEPTQEKREQLRDRKYRFNLGMIAGRDIIAVDDSMVRNTTAPYIVKKLKEFGAKSVSWENNSPPIRFPNFYGIDTPEQDELAAARFTVEQIKDRIDCIDLGFLTLEGLMTAVKRMTSQDRDKFELSCLNGIYQIPIGKRQIFQPASKEKYAA